MFHLLFFAWYLWMLSVSSFFSYFRFQVSTSTSPALNTHGNSLYLWQVAWVFPLCGLNLCIIVSYDILNQVLLVPSCYHQLMPKIFLITLLSMQVRALQITQTEFPAIVLFFFAYYTAIRIKTKGDLLENKASVKCYKTWGLLFVKVEWNSVPHCRYRLRGLFSPSFLYSQIFFKWNLFSVFDYIKVQTIYPSGNKQYCQQRTRKWKVQLAICLLYGLFMLLCWSGQMQYPW